MKRIAIIITGLTAAALAQQPDKEPWASYDSAGRLVTSGDKTPWEDIIPGSVPEILFDQLFPPASQHPRVNPDNDGTSTM
jgi:hypothetical protein